jgi:penicillin-binding protein 1A
VWVGFDAERSLGKQETGGHAAAPIWTAFMKQAVAERPVVDFPVPEGVSFAQIDRATGLRAVAGSNAELEVFVKGSEPKAYAESPEEAPEPEAEPEHEPAAPIDDGVPEVAD